MFSWEEEKRFNEIGSFCEKLSILEIFYLFAKNGKCQFWISSSWNQNFKYYAGKVDYIANWFGWIVWLLILVLKLFKAWFVLGTGCDLQLDFSLAGIGFSLDRLPPWTLQSRARDKPQRIFCQIKFKFGVSAFIVESSACPWLRTLAFPPWPARVAPQSADGVEDSLNRAQASLPLHKQSVGRWTPGRCDVGEERKYFWSLKEKLETTFKAKKSEAWICRSPHRVHRL